ncbi:MAG: hypothetical protein RJA57_1811, partial [Bacteroidota bacterium]
MKTLCTSLLFLLFAGMVPAQEPFPFRIILEPVIPTGFKGLHSYAWAREGQEVLLIGGRTDGLHRRQPFAAFQPRYNNTELVWIDLNTFAMRTTSLQPLPASLREQLQSSNMEFLQDGNRLVLIGGYGYSETKTDPITFPGLITAPVRELIDAVRSGGDIRPYFTQVTDERMAVTGGRLQRIGDRYLLVGGQRFDGRYNPHGPDHGPGFSQQYTNEVRHFKLSAPGTPLQVLEQGTIRDTALLHRRDLNVLPRADRPDMLTLFSGVFRYDKDLPYTTLIDITPDGIREVPAFQQLYNHYHTASLSAYSRKTRTGYSVFFGGIAMHMPDSTGRPVTDTDVPFVKTISVVARRGDRLKEYVLPEVMPGYFGAAADLIPAADAPYGTGGILEIDRIGSGKQLIGHIIGGIDSRAPHVFWSSAAEPSRASPVIWNV